MPDIDTAALDALTRAAVVLARADRVRVEATGPDRAKFLHNLTTQEVKRLAPGSGAEAFVTSPQGKTLGYVHLLVLDDRILLRTERDGFGPVMPHLNRYSIFDEVTLDDVTDRTFELHVAGPEAGSILAAAGVEAFPEDHDGAHAAAAVDGRPVRLVREAPLGVPGFTILGDAADAEAVSTQLQVMGFPRGLAVLRLEAFEPLRIAAGTPAAGRDVTPENLPQEVARDARAISFVKGCYLGQETVARIDALGHVNRTLRGLTLAGTVPPPAGSPVEADGKAVGAITSAAYSPVRGCVVALGYLRNAQARAGSVVSVRAGDKTLEAVVTDLPMPPA